MASSCHIGLIDNNRNRYRMWAYSNNSLCVLVASVKFLAFFWSRKIITFSYLNSINFNDNCKYNFMQ